ncbi:MAG: hypothetical protein KAX65_16865, partial [Caldilineaceae bacterium]|nr:hypothetical protein [Caldilineaceae bacterium]
LWIDRFAPETTWRAGEVICRRAQLRVPAALPPGDYVLSLATPEGAAPVTPLTVTPSARRYELPPFEQPLDASFDDTIDLAGATMQRTGDTLSVTLVWQALAAPDTALTAFVHLLDADGALIAQSDAVPGGNYATTAWAPGEVVVDPHQLNLPAAAPEGSYRLVAGLYDPVTGQRAQAVDSSGTAYADQAVPLFTGELP